MKTLIAKSFLEIMERVKGIEPSLMAWEASALPLSYTRMDCKPIIFRLRKNVNILIVVRSTVRAAEKTVQV